MMVEARAYSGRAPSRLVHAVLVSGRNTGPELRGGNYSKCSKDKNLGGHPSGKRERLPEERGMVLTLLIGSCSWKGRGCRERALPPRVARTRTAFEEGMRMGSVGSMI